MNGWDIFSQVLKEKTKPIRDYWDWRTSPEMSLWEPAVTAATALPLASISLPKDVAKTFWALGDAQRGLPEMAMLKAKDKLGGGPLSVAIEHTGDLTHRMTHDLKWSSPSTGYDDVKDKVDKVLSYLNSPYGFEREYLENLKNVADYRKIPYDVFKTDVDKSLKIYSKEHSKLPVYNEAQWNARNAAINLGEGRYGMTAENLNWLSNALKTRSIWDEVAAQYLLKNGGLMTFPWR
jgi:hypothetical protein